MPFVSATPQFQHRALSRRKQEAVSQDERELTQTELSEVAGDVVCSGIRRRRRFMWAATRFVPGTPDGPFFCWG
jgi:hypothetical protein